MMPKIKLTVLSTTLLLFSQHSLDATTPNAFDLSIANILQASSNRAISFEIDIQAGSAEAIANIPQGWAITVNNDPSGTVKISGGCSLGSATINGQALSQIKVRLRKQPLEGLPFAVHGDVTLLSASQKGRSVTLRGSDFRVQRVY